MTSDTLQCPIAELLPHAQPMLLLDRVVSSSIERFECEVELTEQSEFCEDGFIGSWVGLEYMAQTVAALASTRDLLHRRKVRMGLLLGTRSYVALVPRFAAGQTLRIQAKEVLFDPQGPSMVDCIIRDRDSGMEVARASLTLVQIDDFKTFLASHNK